MMDDMKELKTRLDSYEKQIKALVNLLIDAGTVVPEKLPHILKPLVRTKGEDLFA